MKRRARKEEKNSSRRTPGQRKHTPLSASPRSAWSARGPRLGGGAAVRDAIAPRRLPAFRSRVRALGNLAARWWLPVGGYGSPWVAASPLAFGLLPGQPRRRLEDDNCAETRPLSGWVVQSAQERGPQAAARTSQRPGMRGGEGRAGVPGGASGGSRYRRCPLYGKSRRWPA